MFIKNLLALCILVFMPLLCFGQEYRLKTVFETQGVLWSFDFISADELLITLRRGELIYVHLKQNTQKRLAVPDLVAEGQGGLLDVHYRKIDGQAYVYLTYSTIVNGQLTTALARGLLQGQGQERSLGPLQRLFAARVKGRSGYHFGSRLFFQGPHIYMTIGDRGERDYAQELSYHNGKILRLDLEGKAAAGNPFAGRNNALAEIWSYGHRNPQGIDLDPVSGALYSCEFGPRGGDELNRIEQGKNYGWPVITYGREYWGPKIGETHHPGMEQPVAYWVPSISPSGMSFYRGDRIPEWKNNLFLANLSATHLRRLEFKDNRVIEQEALFADLNERIRHTRSGPDGYLYFSTDSGKLIRIAPAAAQ